MGRSAAKHRAKRAREATAKTPPEKLVAWLVEWLPQPVKAKAGKAERNLNRRWKRRRDKLRAWAVDLPDESPARRRLVEAADLLDVHAGILHARSLPQTANAEKQVYCMALEANARINGKPNYKEVAASITQAYHARGVNYSISSKALWQRTQDCRAQNGNMNLPRYLRVRIPNLTD